MSPAFKWSLATGRDFGRANAWARKQRPEVADFIRTTIPRQSELARDFAAGKFGALTTNQVANDHGLIADSFRSAVAKARREMHESQ